MNKTLGEWDPGDGGCPVRVVWEKQNRLESGAKTRWDKSGDPYSEGSHLIHRQCCTGDGKDRLDVCRSEGLGYLTHGGIVLRQGGNR